MKTTFLPPAISRGALLALAIFGGAQPLFAQALNPQEQTIVNYMSARPPQQRPFLKLDPILESVARARAEDMAARGYFAHVNPDGHGPNYLVRAAGYQLPSWWSTSPTANYIESIGAGFPTAADMWNAWMNSPDHKTHLLATQAFYATETSYGVAYVNVPGSQYQTYWVVITAPPPPLTITSPARGARVLTPTVSASGTASGEPAPASVVWRLENALGTPAIFQPASGVANWTASLTGLAPGSNTLRVRSLDGTGATLAEVTSTFTYVVTGPLTVALSGSGNVTAGFAGSTLREVGVNYTVAATPAAGFVFAGWTGGITASTRALTFTMPAALSLTASFISNPFPAARGFYNGLISVGGTAAGFASLATSATGAFSGRFFFEGVNYALRGQFDAQGDFQTQLARRLLPPLDIHLHLDLTDGTNALTGTIVDGSVTGALMANELVANPALPAHRYTLDLPADAANATAPQGHGFAAINLAANGMAQIVGWLADGTPFTQTAAVSKSGVFPLFVPLAGARGSLAGVLTFNMTGDVSGELTWQRLPRPAVGTVAAIPGFTESIAATGSQFTAVAGTRVLNFTNATGNAVVSINGSGMSAVAQTVTLATNNSVVPLAPNPSTVSLRINPANGLFIGAFATGGKAARFRGAVLQKQNAGRGFFAMPTGSGAVRFSAAP